MKRVANLNEQPPGGWVYTIPETGKRIGPHAAHRDWLNEIRKYYAVNQLLCPPNIEDLAHEQICSHLPNNVCSDGNMPTRDARPVGKFQSVVTGTLTMGDWFINGRLMGNEKLVDEARAIGRGLVCSKCEHNVPVGRCAPCVAGRLEKAIKRIVGNSKTPIDDKLQACNLCGCSLKSKVWMPLELLKRHMRPEHLQQFPDYCWLVHEKVDQTSKAA